jgi:hypothetical protein
MAVYEFPNGKVLWADEAFKFDLSGCLVQEDKDLVIVIKALVKQQGLDVLLGEELLQLNELVLLGHEEQRLALKDTLTYARFMKLIEN